MKIKVKAFAHMKDSLEKLAPEGELDVPEGATVGTVLHALNLLAYPLKIVLVNGRPRSEDYRLRPGDDLVLFPPLEGG